MKWSEMNNWSIRVRVLFLALAPVLLGTAILGYAAISARIEDVNNGLHERGHALAKHLAFASEFGLFSGNADQLRTLAQAALRESDVDRVVILDADMRPVVEVAKTTRDPDLLVSFEEIVVGSGVAAFDFNERAAVEETASAVPLGVVRVAMSRQSSIERAHQIVIASVAIGVGGVLLSLVLALWVGRSVINPVSRLTAMVQSLGRGALSARVSPDSGGELGMLERGFNAMAGSIESAQRTLQHKVDEATSALQRTVATLEQRNRELDAARDQALQAGQAKADFLARMSHEVRTPINAVIGFAKLLANTADPAQQHEYAQTINQAAAQLLSVVDDILQFSRIESGAVQLEHIPFDLRDSLEEVVCMLRPGAHAKHLELVLMLGSDVPVKLVGDPTRFGQVLTNLVNNALKFTAAGGITIRVSLVERNAERTVLRVSVADTGIGITAGERQRLFSAFSQADTSVSRRYGGTGLGLAIAKRLVDLMQGEIGVDSAEGQGATFWFTTPWALQAAPATLAAVKPLAGHKVLLVEEHAIARRALRNQLLDWSLEVYTAAERARLPPMLHHAAQAGDPFDLVMVSAPAALLDLHPLYAQLAAARDIYAGPILLLVNAEHCDLPQSLQADTAIRCLAKPPRLKTLHATLAQLLGVTAAAAPEAPTTASAASSAFAGLRVLLAEDNDFNRTLITTWLQAKGVVVDVAHDGEAAVQRARAQRHDVILMDIHMPVLDGIEAARRIRAAEEYATHVPIIALTADVFAGERNNLLAAGMDDCVFKPVREELLWDAIARLTGRAPRAAAADASAAPLPTEASAVPAALYQKLYAELPLHQQQIHAAFTAGDCVAAREAAHRLSGVAGYFGVATLARLARELERALQASGLDVARPVHEALDREIARVLADREAADD